MLKTQVECRSHHPYIEIQARVRQVKEVKTPTRGSLVIILQPVHTHLPKQSGPYA
jgi:hypothetical protein